MIFTISLVETGLYLILGKVTLKTSDKYFLKVLVLSLRLQLFSILLIIESATNKKYLLKDSVMSFELADTVLKLFWVGKVSY
jgi:intracellular septation protein A